MLIKLNVASLLVLVGYATTENKVARQWALE